MMPSARHTFQTLSHGGAFSAVVEAGRLVGVEPFPDDPAPNDTIRAWPEMVYADNRVKRPSARRGWLAALESGRTPSGAERGREAFVEIPWPEALDLVAGELARVRSAHGNAALFGGSYGWSSAGRLHHARTLVHRFMASIGGCTGQATNYSYGAAMRLLPHIVGTIEAVGGPVTDWASIAKHCEHVVAFGGIAAKNWKIQSGGAGLHPYDAFMARAKAAGVAFTSVSPSNLDIAPELGATWLPIRPGTDTAMILAMAHVVDQSGATDEAFVARYCVGFDRFRASLRGEDGSEAKTPEWAAAITGIPAADIEAFARRLIGRRTMFTAAWSLQRAEHGEQPYWSLVALAAMLGQIGLPGCGVAFGYGSINGMGNPNYRLPVAGLPVPKRPDDVQIPVARVADMLLDPGATIEFDGGRITYPDIRLVYWAGGNPFHHHQDLFRLQQAMRRPETVVVHEPWWTPTARHADMVLPATTPMERNDIGGSSRDPYLFAMHRAIEPVHEAMNDFDIFSSLADRLDAGTAFHEGRSEMEWLELLYGRFVEATAKRGVDMPAFQDFWRAGHVRIPEPAADYTLFADFRRDPVAHPLRTPSGRIEIFSQTVADFGYAECPGLPVWREPSEWLGAPLAQSYPLHLLSNQPPEKLHSQMDGSSASRAREIKGRNVLLMCPQDAAARGLSEGDLVRIHNGRGACIAGLEITDGLIAGVVSMATGAFFEPLASSNDRYCNHGNPNVLTQDIPTSRLGQGCSAQTCLVEVEKHDGKVEDIRIFAEPHFAARTAFASMTNQGKDT